VHVALLLAGLARAEPPVVVADGTAVRSSFHLPVPPERLLIALQDPTWEARVAGEDTRVTPLGPDGVCQRVAYVSPNLVQDLHYELRRCPTADGFDSTLVASDGLASYHARWTVRPEGSGCRVDYLVDLTITLWAVPDSLVRAETRRGVAKRLAAIAAWAEAPVSPPGPAPPPPPPG